jgi:exodeoxyribonuclease VII large subunit
VADKRAETPSAAIMLLVPNRREVSDGLKESTARLREAVQNRLTLARQRVDQLAARPAFRRPADRLRELEQRLDDTAARLRRAIQLNTTRSRDRLTAAAEQLDALSPLNVLKRGYTLTRRGDGAVVRSPADVTSGEVLTTTLAGGSILSRVISTQAEDSP